MTGAAAKQEHLDRVHASYLAPLEKELLIALAHRIPKQFSPDHLTVLGVVGAFIIAVGAIGSHFSPIFYIVAVAGLAINWFGDSLDGTVARTRRIERPRYGFFVDQFSDVASHMLMLIGLGLSPIMRLDTALLALLASLATMFYGHLKLQFSRTWHVSHHAIGPTELRIIIAAGLLVAFFGELPSFASPAGVLTLFDVVGIAVFLIAMLSIGIMFASDRRKLAEIDPPRHLAPRETVVVPLPVAQAQVHATTLVD